MEDNSDESMKAHSPVSADFRNSLDSVAPPLVLSPFSRDGGAMDKIPQAQLEQENESLRMQLAHAKAELEKEKAQSFRLSTTVSFLEEQNQGLLAENTTLGESLSIFIRVGGAGVAKKHNNGEADTNLPETEALREAEAVLKKRLGGGEGERETDAAEWRSKSDLRGRVSALLRCITGKAISTETAAGCDECRDALMLQAIESLAGLVHLSTTLAPARLERGSDEETEDDIRREELDISLRNAFVGAVRVLSDVVVNPGGQETAELLEPFPNQWLLNNFPYKRAVREGSAGGGETYMLVSQGVGKGPDSWLPLHWALVNREPDLVDVEVLMEELAETVFGHDVSPLSVAVSKGVPSVEAVEVLIGKNKEAVAAHDAADGAIPLMHACACNEGCEVVQMLYEAHPGGASEMDSAGFRAINYAAYSGYPAIVRYLLSAHPRSASLPAKNGSLALHDSAENALRGGLQMVDEIFQANTTAIMQPDEDGALPIHRAARAGSLEIVQYLHRLYPKSVSTEDREGLLPMHYASQRTDKDLNLSIVQYFVEN